VNLAKLRSNYILVCIVLLSVGAASEYVGSNIDPTFKAISLIDDTGQVIKKDVLSFPVAYSVVRILSGIFYTLAISIFVSVFITDRIEADLDRKREQDLNQQREAINIDVFDSLFRTLIPEEIFAVIKSSVIETKTVRRNADWIYDFSVPEQGVIDLRQTISYELHNISSEEVSEPTKVDFATFGDITQSLEQARCEVESHTIVIFDKDNPPDKNVGITITRNNELEKTLIEFNVIIPPRKYGYITMVFQNRHKHSVQDEYFTKTALVNGSLTANFPEDYEFKLYSDMSAELRCIEDGKSRKRYKLKGAILPHQGYVYYLYKTDRDAQTNANQ
jgi:hypothetical protein